MEAKMAMKAKLATYITTTKTSWILNPIWQYTPKYKNEILQK